MSDIDSKVKHEKRIQQKFRHMKRQAKIAKQFGQPFVSEHEFAKHNAMNCGNPGCLMCANPRKVWREQTIQEKRFYQDVDG